MDNVDERERSIDLLNSIPFVAVHVAAVWGVIHLGWSWRGLGLAVALYYVRMFFITAGYHRYLSHRTFQMSRPLHSSSPSARCRARRRGSCGGRAITASTTSSRTSPGDVHSALREGFVWRHVGSILSRRYAATEDARVKDLAKYPEFVWLDKWWWVPPTALGVTLFLVGGWFALVWGFLVSTVLLWHGTFTINSLTHIFGSRRYPTTDNSRNNPLLAAITLGEGWHNNHHYYQRSTRQGFWWEVDPTYIVLRMMAALGLVWDLHEPPEEVVIGSRPVVGGQLAPLRREEVRTAH